MHVIVYVDKIAPDCWLTYSHNPGLLYTRKSKEDAIAVVKKALEKYNASYQIERKLEHDESA